MHIDKLGHCVQCGKNLITEKVVNTQHGMEVKRVFVPDYSEETFLLDDESKMRVVMCKPCKMGYDEKDNKKVMKSVIAGWQKEVDELETWDKEKKDKHMKVYKKKKIKNKLKESKHGVSI